MDKPTDNILQRNYQERLRRASAVSRGKEVAATDIVRLLEAVIEPGDRICLEGNNQKQADFLAASLVRTSTSRVHDLHIVQSVLSLPQHMELIERGQGFKGFNQDSVSAIIKATDPRRLEERGA